MINASGIGTYLKNLIPLIISNFPNIKFTLLGKETELFELELNKFVNVDFIPFDIPIYTINEQVVVPSLIPKNTNLYWSPHYNIPVLYNGKLLVTIHDINHIALPQGRNDWLKKKYAKYLLNMIMKKADKIVTVSKFTKNEILEYFGQNNLCDKIVTIHNGLAKIIFNRGDKPHNKPYLLYVGNIKPHKNLSRLLDAFKQIMHKVPHDLILVGKKSGFITGDKHVIKKVVSFGHRVILTDFLPDNKLWNFLFHADIFVFPSLYEGFGFPPLEAMAVGTPVVASNISSIPEVCGNSALYFNPYNIDDMADKILQMIKDSGLKKEYIFLGSEQVKKYEWEISAEKTNNLIQNILQS